MTDFEIKPFFLSGEKGRLFAMLHTPPNPKHSVVFVPPFGEEMNKCRRQITQTAHALCEQNCAVLVVDLYGTGDSEGDFAEADWDIWKSDIAAAMSWMENNNPVAQSLVATRLGCILAAESLLDSGRTVANAVFWHPVASGRKFMTQFLRLQVAASMLDSGGQVSVDELRSELNDGAMLEIAGYELTARLWRSIEDVDILPSLHKGLGKLHVIEVGRARNDGVSPAGKKILNVSSECGIEVSGQRIPGDPIWAATEIVTNSELQKATVAHLT